MHREKDYSLGMLYSGSVYERISAGTDCSLGMLYSGSAMCLRNPLPSTGPLPRDNHGDL